MPAASFIRDCDKTNSEDNTLDQRALQLAWELSVYRLMTEEENVNYDQDTRSKKSQNTTECVPVPSSEHVAEIVGRQGCKIKALRAKTNTYIKTPVRGEEPVFVVTGRKEDVSAAKKEILSAADHFSQIRAQRKSNLSGGNGIGPGPNSSLPGQLTIQVRVPYRVVGLVVGPKGATIKRIQLMTSTYIITPSRDKEPIFEVTGLPENVEKARQEIEAHIAVRTGGRIDSGGGASSSTPDSESSGSSREYSSPLLQGLFSSMSNGFGNNQLLSSNAGSLINSNNVKNSLISSFGVDTGPLFPSSFSMASLRDCVDELTSSSSSQSSTTPPSSTTTPPSSAGLLSALPHQQNHHSHHQLQQLHQQLSSSTIPSQRSTTSPPSFIDAFEREVRFSYLS